MSDPYPHMKTSRSPIPRSRSDFCYVNLTPTEKRKTTDFSHLLPQFNRDPPYVRLLDSKVPIVEQPKHSKPVPLAVTAVCRSATGSCTVVKSPTVDVIRSQSMRSLRRTLEMSPTKHNLEDASKRNSEVPADLKSSEGADSSLPMDEKDLTRLRNFSTTSKGLVNWGDSFRSRSMPFVPSNGPTSDFLANASELTPSSSLPRSATASACATRSPTRHRIVILGSSNVGKTSMIKQFRTSEYICAFDGGNSNNDENNDYAITVVLNGEESDLEFVDCCSLEEETEDEGSGDDTGVPAKPYIPTADAYVVVYSVTSRRSFLHALRLVSRVQSVFLSSVILLVGNKSDLVRIRAVTTDEARTSAKERNCPFLETSVAINHQVDELLVAILTEIRNAGQMCSHVVAKMSSPHHCSLNKAKGLLKKFLKKACFQSKSCDNLQRL